MECDMTQVDYRTVRPLNPGRRGIVASMTGGVAAITIVAWLLFVNTADLHHGGRWIGLVVWAGLFSIVSLWPALFIISVVAVIVAARRPRTKPDFLMMAWVVLFFEALGWAWLLLFVAKELRRGPILL
jgi:hypothetical protein